MATLGMRVDAESTVVTVDGVRLPVNPALVYWLVYKPQGVITTTDDPQGRQTVRSLVPSAPPTNPVGRLDLDSEGLLLMTNDGALTNIVTHPRYGVPKTYRVLVPQNVASADISALISGIPLEDGMASAQSAKLDSTSGERSVIELVLTEGRKREIRRMFSHLHIPIDRLVRIAIGPIADRTLQPGSHRTLSVEEIRLLYSFEKQADHDV
ncbi:MAG: pseudouridine synthase [Acidimicrobiia bacterium]